MIVSLKTTAQNDSIKRYTTSNKGKFFLSWGGNRGAFSKSDITFKGNGYNFTLYDVVSRDKPKGWHIDYINPVRMTIPQTNFSLKYFITDKYSVALSIDHMKYTIISGKTVRINGTINLPADEPGAVFNNTYNNENITLTEDFLKLEHTDGLNYYHVEFSRLDDVSSLFKIRNTDKFQVNITTGLGAGILYPKTNATLLSKGRHDEFNVAGYGASAKAGLVLTFFKHFFVEGDLKAGYIKMPDIRTTYDKADSASQDFFFFERVIMFGGIFRLF